MSRLNGGSAALETPLHAAIAEKQRDVAELLVIRGADVNAKNMSGRTPLHFLAYYIDDPGLARLMVEHGANLNAIDRNGATPFDIAEKTGHPGVAAILKGK